MRQTLGLCEWGFVDRPNRFLTIYAIYMGNSRDVDVCNPAEAPWREPLDKDSGANKSLNTYVQAYLRTKKVTVDRESRV